MSALTLHEVLAELQRGGLIAEVPPPLAPVPPATPWYVRVMAGFGAWLGGVFLLGATVGLFAALAKSPGGLMVIGLLLLGAAFGIYRAARDIEALQQFALAFSMAGQLAVAFGIEELMHWRTEPMAWFVCLMQIALVIVMPHALHRFMSALFAAIAMYIGLQAAHAAALGALVLAPLVAWLWHSEPKWVAAGRRDLLQPVAYALALALLFWEAPLSASWLFGYGGDTWRFAVPRFLAPMAYGFTCVALAGTVARELAPRVWSYWAAAVALVCAAAALAPGLVAALLVLLLGFAAGRRVLVGMALLAAIWYLGAYYYRLQITLLEKSGVMLATGAVLIGLRFLLTTLWPLEKHHE